MMNTIVKEMTAGFEPRITDIVAPYVLGVLLNNMDWAKVAMEKQELIEQYPGTPAQFCEDCICTLIWLAWGDEA